MTSDQFQYLSTQRAAEFIGDSAALHRLLGTLKTTLATDLPTLRKLLADGDTQGVNDLLHQFKGFMPVFCVDSLVELVVKVEAMTQNATVKELQQAMAPLLDQLSSLQAEVDRQLSA